MPATIRFDTRVCGRCAGSGQYSYNPRDGSVCYGCSGKGKVRTKPAINAAAALKAWAADVASVPVTEVKVGDVVLLAQGFGRDRYVEVKEVEHRDDDFAAFGSGNKRWETTKSVTLRAVDGGQRFHVFPDLPVDKVRRRLTVEEYAQYIEFARTLKGVTIVEEEE